MEDWMPRYSDEEVRIDFEDVEYNMYGDPIASQFTFTDLTKKIECQDLEDFALAQMEGEWTVQTSYWAEGPRAFVVVATVPQPNGALV
jgi:predicted component of viral defense system (DUF524 family)